MTINTTLATGRQLGNNDASLVRGRTAFKPGAIRVTNHNESLLRISAAVKPGALRVNNHNETLVRLPARVPANLKADGRFITRDGSPAVTTR